MSIDWSKAPEGTTHANPLDPLGMWRRVQGQESDWWNATQKTWIRLHPMAYKQHKGMYVEKPVGEKP